MKFYKIDINIIRNIIEIYNQDHTNMKIRSDMNIRFDITSGIRQGCNLSSTIFKMITYRIMDEIEPQITKDEQNREVKDIIQIILR